MPKFDMPSEMEARFGRTPLGGETLGLSLMKLAPNFRVPFGHKHEAPEGVEYLGEEHRLRQHFGMSPDASPSRLLGG